MKWGENETIPLKVMCRRGEVCFVCEEILEGKEIVEASKKYLERPVTLFWRDLIFLVTSDDDT